MTSRRSVAFASCVVFGLAGCGGSSSSKDDPSIAAELAAPQDALHDDAPLSDGACAVVASNGTRTTERRSLVVTIRAVTIPGALTAKITSLDDPSLSVTATFDGVWNTFEGSARSAAGTWLDVRGRMTGSAITVSYAERGVAAPGGAAPSVHCQSLTGTATFSLPTPVKAPPPSWCELSSPTSVGLHATLRIDTYEGLEVGFNTHEHARATIVNMPWIYDASLVDTMHVELAMRVGSGGGLPHEIPLVAGQLIEIEGEYIPASIADAPNPNGHDDAVIHYTHAECGYSVIAGVRYN